MAYNPNAKFTIHNGDMLTVLPTLPGKFHAVLCDPPYGISFMGKEWDTAAGPAAFQARVKTWGETLLPLLYPGALCLMFGGTRMWHRLAAGMEDAGFEMWDTIMWIHGQGFPKGQDISKLIDNTHGISREVIGYDATRFRPNRVNNFYGGFHEDNGATITAAGSEVSAPWSGHKTCALKPAWEPVLCFRAPAQGKSYAELAQMFGSGSLNIDGGRIAGDIGIGPDRYPANLALDEESAVLLDEQSGPTGFNDSGGASRFFYCAKAGTAERDGGLDNYKAEFSPTMGNGIGNAEHDPDTATKKRNHHPTVKPIDLCEWLAKLLLPPSSVENRCLLVPFSGSGSEMIGSLGAGWDEVVGVELDAAYCDIARARIKYHNGLGSGGQSVVAVEEAQPGLF